MAGMRCRGGGRMAMTVCRERQGDVSPEAESCPALRHPQYGRIEAPGRRRRVLVPLHRPNRALFSWGTRPEAARRADSLTAFRLDCSPVRS